jgi:cyanophycin synthetase
VDQVNADPARAEGHGGVLTSIKIRFHYRRHPRRAGATLDSVLKEGEVLYLKRTPT